MPPTRQRALAKLAQASGVLDDPDIDKNEHALYGPECKAKAYAAFLDGQSWSDCARAMGHPNPTKGGVTLVRRWAKEDRWTRQTELSYKDKVEQSRASDPQRISHDIDGLCVRMQRVVENYIEQFFDPDTHRVEIPHNFKSRDFADMAAALRMIHETRIKIRKAIAPDPGKEDKKSRDFLSLIREAGLSRVRENQRRRTLSKPRQAIDESDPPPDDESHPDTIAGEQPAIALPSLADIRAQIASMISEAAPEPGEVQDA